MSSLGWKIGVFALAMASAVGLEASVTPSSAMAFGTTNTQRLLQRGPYGSATATLTLVDALRKTPANGTPGGDAGYAAELPTRTLPTKVWYPAKNTALDGVTNGANGEPAFTLTGFPLIVYGHGLGSTADDITHVASHLASHGYVVASVTFPLSHFGVAGGPTAADVLNQPLDMLFVASTLRTTAFVNRYAFASRIHPVKTGLMGYSLGGVSAAMAATAPNVLAVATLAPATCALYQPGGLPVSITQPLMVIGGDTDAVTPLHVNGDLLYSHAIGPKYLVHIANGSHGGFLANGADYEKYGPIDTAICSAVRPTPAPLDGVAEACQPCTNRPAAAQLSTARQHQLEIPALLSFFDVHLRSKVLDSIYLTNGLENENPELSVSSEGPLGL